MTPHRACERGAAFLMNNIVKKLLELQKIDADILSLIDEEKNIPRELKRQQSQYNACLAACEEEQKGYADIRAAHERMRVEIEEKEDAIKTLEAKQSQVKKNQEYQALTHEISAAVIARDALEATLKEHNTLVEKAKEKCEEARKKVEEERAAFLVKAEEAKTRLKDIKQKKARYKEIRRDEAKSIPQSTLDIYDHIFLTRAPLVVVPANNNVCGGCHVNLPPQVMGDIMKGEVLVTCECCSRILYLDDSSA